MTYTPDDVLAWIEGELARGHSPSYNDVNIALGVTTGAHHVTRLLREGRLGRTEGRLYVRSVGDVLDDPAFQSQYPQVAEELARLRALA